MVWRVSVEDRQELRERCDALGITVQTYLEHLVYGRELQPRRKDGPKPRSEKDIELPMTG